MTEKTETLPVEEQGPTLTPLDLPLPPDLPVPCSKGDRHLERKALKMAHTLIKVGGPDFICGTLRQVGYHDPDLYPTTLALRTAIGDALGDTSNTLDLWLMEKLTRGGQGPRHHLNADLMKQYRLFWLSRLIAQRKD